MLSSAPTARANLVTALAARAGLSGVQVLAAMPTATNMQQDCIYLAKTVWESEEGILSGDTKRRERYHIELQIHVVRAGDDAVTVDNRAWALFAEVESQLVNPSPGDPTLAGALNGWAEIKPVEHTPGWTEGRRVSMIDANVYCVHKK